ncbi:MAG: hypothetical protein CHACPFDD_00312 [Phycisphaerae bacterium]|nr:hypothetical protein [Phycisphaerae bacterium]
MLVAPNELIERARAELTALPAAASVRLAYAAAHVVMRDEYANCTHTPDHPADAATLEPYIDWDATLDIRRRLALRGFGIAEAMDTAQRFAIGWENAARLITQTGDLSPPVPFIAGAGADGVAPPAAAPPARRRWTPLIDEVIRQAHFIRSAGGLPIILPLPTLVRSAATPPEFFEVYAAIIRAVPGPLFVHWLGEAFMPELRGYFPADSFERIMELDPAKVRGVKLSLLDPAREIDIRQRLLARDQIVLTGDDLHFPELIAGDAGADLRWSSIDDGRGARPLALGDFGHALLGILDAISEPASLALQFLAHARHDRYLDLMAPCARLAAAIFEPPTWRYKAGLALIAWLNGWQTNRMLVNHEERVPGIAYDRRVAELALAAGCITPSDVAVDRLATLTRDST